MSLYALQQFMFDALRQPGTSADGYELMDEESSAVSSNDIAAFYVMGVHPVLLNAWCRATGYTRDQYREVLAPHRTMRGGRPRWRTS